MWPRRPGSPLRGNWLQPMKVSGLVERRWGVGSWPSWVSCWACGRRALPGSRTAWPTRTRRGSHAEIGV
eukprot:3059149-Pyramimonas_sp.AAC.1